MALIAENAASGRRRVRWRKTATAASALGLAVLIWASWALRFVGDPKNSSVPLDIGLYFWPIYETTYGRIAKGLLPLWNPYQLCGLPWVATLQGGFFYPPHVLFLFLPVRVSMAVSGVAHLIFAALTTLAFARRAGLSYAAAVLAAVLFTVRGQMADAVSTPNFLEAAAWLPLGALGVLDLVRTPSPRAVGWVALATGMSLLAGYPQPTMYLFYTWATLLVALLLGERVQLGRWLSAGSLFACALALGMVVAAAQLFPTAELTRVGVRATRQLDVSEMGGIYMLLGAVILKTKSLAGAPSAFGVVALALAGAAIFARRRRAVALWAILLALLSAELAIGPVTPPRARLFFLLPGIAWFRMPSRWILVTDFAVSIAAGIGLDAILGEASSEPAGQVDQRRLPRMAPVVAALVGIVLVEWLARAGYAPPESVAALRCFALAAAALLVLRPFWRARWSRAVFGTAFVVLVTLEISLAPPFAWRLPYRPADEARLGLFAKQFERLAQMAGHDRVWFYAMGLDPAVALKQATRYRFRAATDYEPLNLGRQAEYFRYFTDGTTRVTRAPVLFSGDVPTLAAPAGTPSPATRRRLLDLAAIRFFGLPSWTRRQSKGGEGSFLADAGFQPLPLLWPGLELFENPRVLPRAFVVYRTRPAPDSEALLGLLSRDEFDPLVESYVEGAPPLPADPDAPERGHAASFVVDDETVVELEATLDAPGLVVLADTFYPGWRATVDGMTAPIYATNHLFRGVPVGAGTHRVRFEYRPRSVRIGAALSGLGIVAVAGLLARGRRATGTSKPTF